MKKRGCQYRDKREGRSWRSERATGGLVFKAGLTCHRCGCTEWLGVRSDATPPTIDLKFTAHGWRLDPHVCPHCISKERKKPMATRASPAAMKAQVTMFSLLTTHFDTELGQYASDWNDARIAKETGIAPELVIEFRRAGFGEIKEPSEIRALRDDINALASLAAEQHATMQQELASLRARLGVLSARWAA